MPQTSRGYWYEHYPEDPIGHSVRTGFSGDPSGNDHLAQQVNDDMDQVDVDVAALQSDIAALQATIGSIRWRHIDSDIRGAGDFTLVIPAGFERLRLTMHGDMDGTGDVCLRVNGSSADYQWGREGIDATGNVDYRDHSATVPDGTRWKVAQWATVESNNLIVDIFPTDGTHNPSFLATSHRDSASATGLQFQRAAGKWVQDQVISSLTVIDLAANFAAVRYWLEGYLAP